MEIRINQQSGKGDKFVLQLETEGLLGLLTHSYPHEGHYVKVDFFDLTLGDMHQLSDDIREAAFRIEGEEQEARFQSEIEEEKIQEREREEARG